jgi:hypothetical protein
MRVNIYKEERTEEVAFVRETAGTNQEFIGVRFFLESPKELHLDSGDDDRSAVTFWGRSRNEMIEFFSTVLEKLENSK